MVTSGTFRNKTFVISLRELTKTKTYQVRLVPSRALQRLRKVRRMSGVSGVSGVSGKDPYPGPISWAVLRTVYSAMPRRRTGTAGMALLQQRAAAWHPEGTPRPGTRPAEVCMCACV